MRWFKYLIFSLVVLFIGSCSPKKYVTIAPQQIPKASQSKGISRAKSEADKYAYDYFRKYPHQIRRLRINLHFTNNTARTENLDGAIARDFGKRLVADANRALETNHPMRLPLGNTTEVWPIPYRYELYDANGGDGIYFHYDDELYYVVKKGKDRNVYDRSVFKKYGVGLDSIINVFVMPHHPDSIGSRSYGGTVSGIALKNAVKINGEYKKTTETWHFVGNMNHELGHILGLYHSWGNDVCTDTPRHPNCWSKTESGPCKDAASNNMMDYNNAQNSLTPCQIGIIRRRYLNERHFIRNYFMPDYCQYDSFYSRVITEDEEWTHADDIQGDVTVASGVNLTINTRISLAENAAIKLEKGAKLILGEKAKIHNACGLEWKGVVAQDGDASASFVITAGAKLENVKN